MGYERDEEDIKKGRALGKCEDEEAEDPPLYGFTQLVPSIIHKSYSFKGILIHRFQQRQKKKKKKTARTRQTPG